MHEQSTSTEQTPATEPVEPRGVRIRRHGHRARLYASAFALVALLVLVVALTVANTRQVELNWLVGSGEASLVWIIAGATIIGWLLGIATTILFRLRTRRRHET